MLTNDAETAKTVQPVLRSFLGEKTMLAEFPKAMGSEDIYHLVWQYLIPVLGRTAP